MHLHVYAFSYKLVTYISIIISTLIVVSSANIGIFKYRRSIKPVSKRFKTGYILTMQPRRQNMQSKMRDFAVQKQIVKNSCHQMSSVQAKAYQIRFRSGRFSKTAWGAPQT